MWLWNCYIDKGGVDVNIWLRFMFEDSVLSSCICRTPSISHTDNLILAYKKQKQTMELWNWFIPFATHRSTLSNKHILQKTY